MSYSSLTNKYIPASADNYMRGRGGYKVCKIIKYVKLHHTTWRVSGVPKDALNHSK